jgi:hypothetical protein
LYLYCILGVCEARLHLPVPAGYPTQRLPTTGQQVCTLGRGGKAGGRGSVLVHDKEEERGQSNQICRLKFTPRVQDELSDTFPVQHSPLKTISACMCTVCGGEGDVWKPNSMLQEFYTLLRDQIQILQNYFYCREIVKRMVESYTAIWRTAAGTVLWVRYGIVGTVWYCRYGIVLYGRILWCCIV